MCSTTIFKWRNAPTFLDDLVWFKLAGEGQLQGWGGEVWEEPSFLKDDGKGEQQGWASAGQRGGTPDVEYLQVGYFKVEKEFECSSNCPGSRLPGT